MAPNKILLVNTEVLTANATSITTLTKIRLSRVSMLVQIRLFLEGKTMWTSLLIIIAEMDQHALIIIRETEISRFGREG